MVIRCTFSLGLRCGSNSLLGGLDALLTGPIKLHLLYSRLFAMSALASVTVTGSFYIAYGYSQVTFASTVSWQMVLPSGFPFFVSATYSDSLVVSSTVLLVIMPRFSV